MALYPLEMPSSPSPFLHPTARCLSMLKNPKLDRPVVQLLSNDWTLLFMDSTLVYKSAQKHPLHFLIFYLFSFFQSFVQSCTYVG